MSDRTIDDDLLIERSKSGDRSAFDALVRKYEARAYQYAFRLTRNPEEAGDVVAEGFVRVYNALKHFKSQAAFTTWLYRIMTNCFLDMRKKDRHRGATSLDLMIQAADGEVERQVEDPAPSPHEQTEVKERDHGVESAIGQLPEYQRAMIVMYHAEMLTYEEIAAALDLPLGTVKSRLNRARLNLRDLLAKDEELFRLG
jgi:RNA polymerase sigma-70 factor, ECF subfamily